MPTADVNIVAVFVAAVLTFVLGAIWYSPVLFARQWMDAHGYTPETAAERRTRGALRAYAISLACYVIMAYVLALLVEYTNATGPAQGLWLGILAWLGFVATTGLTAQVFSDKRFATWVIDAAYQLASLLAMGLILASWR
jgi:hypothetical protein